MTIHACADFKILGTVSVEGQNEVFEWADICANYKIGWTEKLFLWSRLFNKWFMNDFVWSMEHHLEHEISSHSIEQFRGWPMLPLPNRGSTVVNSGWTGWNRGKPVMFYKDKRSVRDLKQYRRNTRCEDTYFGWIFFLVEFHYSNSFFSRHKCVLKTVLYRLT